MRTRLLNVALLAGLLLAVTRFWMFLGEPPPSLPPLAAEATAPEPEATDREQRAEVAEFRPEAYDVIVARDLFSPTRGVIPPAPAATAGSRVQPPPRLTLYGVVIVDDEKAAYLQEGTQESRPRKVRVNENFAGGVVKTIRADAITFLFSGSEIRVPLRTPKFGAEAPSARGQGQSAPAPSSGAPVVFPRRQLPAPGRPATVVPAIQAVGPGNAAAYPGMSVVPPVEPGEEAVADEEFPEEPAPEGEMPDQVEMGATE